ncbi:MAG: ATP-binding cassette domain-containing protein, partial [Spirochaetales bacterium]|nr:ATP-binding cassette domain-containing protein [Spirochaetales bacterium]
MLPLLCIDDVSAGYGEKIVIKDFSLTVNKGDHILLLGPNGSGKTTLFRLILGIIPPMKGKVEYPMGRSVSYARQDPPSSPFPISVEEVVEMGLWKSEREREKTINEALEMTDALHLKKRLFHSLSGGERQRVSLSRCLAQNSPLILLDEPSSFLDRESRDSFISLMEKVATPERAIIAITHDSTVIDRLGW